jgi:hypothetical protein
MSLKQWALSVLFVWHLIATVLGAFASSDEERSVAVSSQPPTDALAALVTPVLDRIAAAVAPFPSTLARTSGPFRSVTNFYLQITGLGQNWKMFSGPPKVHQYMRVRYYVGPRGDFGGFPANPAWFATELIQPAHREDRVRFLQSYRDSFSDKAMAIAMSRFRRDRDAELIRPNTTSAELPDDLAPIARYFARRFETRNLRSDETVLRTEVWYGEAPMPLPGTSDPESTEARWAVLRPYYEGPVENHFGRPYYPVYHNAEEEGDIFWILEYFEP